MRLEKECFKILPKQYFECDFCNCFYRKICLQWSLDFNAFGSISILDKKNLKNALFRMVLVKRSPQSLLCMVCAKVTQQAVTSDNSTSFLNSLCKGIRVLPNSTSIKRAYLLRYNSYYLFIPVKANSMLCLGMSLSEPC